MKVSSEQLLLCATQDLARFSGLDPCLNESSYAAKALIDSLVKKSIDDKEPTADKKALDLFLSVNEGLIDRVETSELYDEYLIGELRNELYRFWYKSSSEGLVPSLHAIYLHGRVGPGKSLGSEYNDEYCKLYQSKLTVTNSELYLSYRASSSLTELTDAAEKRRAEEAGAYEVVRHSKLLFVPKRADISRTICVEPSLNMFYQLGLARILESRLREVYSIDLSVQPDFNRELARRGSVDGSFATIDLSSASDSMSVGVLRNILPRDFFSWLMSLRTPAVKLPDGRVVPLKMISTMGNGFTFPLQTIIFAAVVSSCYRLSGKPLHRNMLGLRRSPGNFAVFGDDIIVEKEVFSKVVRLLTLLGFKVNTDKTFVEGPFRESCGSDFFNGHFVRGVYIKTLRTPQDRYTLINLLNDWSAVTGIGLPETVRTLCRTVKPVFVPPASGLDEGIHVPLSLKGVVRYDRNGSVKYRSFKAVPRQHRIGDSGEIKQRSLVNPDGLICCVLNGSIRSQAISLRQRDVRYVVKKGLSPCWDFVPFTRSKGRFSFTRWGTAVYLNLYGCKNPVS